MDPNGETGRGVEKQNMLMYEYNNKRYESRNVRGVSIGSEDGAPSRKGCVVNGRMTKASNTGVLPPAPSRERCSVNGQAAEASSK